MAWNYRLVRFKARKGHCYKLCEVYYDAAGVPEGYCDAAVAGDTIKECFEDMQMQIEGMRKARLWYPEHFKPHHTHKEG